MNKRTKKILATLAAAAAVALVASAFLSGWIDLLQNAHASDTLFFDNSSSPGIADHTAPLTSDNYVGQTFTVSSNITLTSIKVGVNNNGYSGTANFEIFSDGGTSNHFPNTDLNCGGTLSLASAPADYSLTEITMAGTCTLTAGTRYVLIAKNGSGRLRVFYAISPAASEFFLLNEPTSGWDFSSNTYGLEIQIYGTTSGGGGGGTTAPPTTISSDLPNFIGSFGLDFVGTSTLVGSSTLWQGEYVINTTTQAIINLITDHTQTNLFLGFLLFFLTTGGIVAYFAHRLNR